MPTSQEAETSLMGASRPQRGAMARASRPGLVAGNASNGEDLREIDKADAQSARSEVRMRAPAYPQASFFAASTVAA
jgi:hypothetical protein